MVRWSSVLGAVSRLTWRNTISCRWNGVSFAMSANTRIFSVHVSINYIAEYWFTLKGNEAMMEKRRRHLAGGYLSGAASQQPCVSLMEQISRSCDLYSVCGEYLSLKPTVSSSSGGRLLCPRWYLLPSQPLFNGTWLLSCFNVIWMLTILICMV